MATTAAQIISGRRYREGVMQVTLTAGRPVVVPQAAVSGGHTAAADGGAKGA
jgi:hypothetical protein